MHMSYLKEKQKCVHGKVISRCQSAAKKSRGPVKNKITLARKIYGTIRTVL